MVEVPYLWVWLYGVCQTVLGRWGEKDFSPISLRCLQNYYHPNGLFAIHHKYGVKRKNLCRIGGRCGYRTLSRISTTSSSTMRRAMWMRTTLPLDLWLGRGRPLNPYLKGFLVEFLRKELKGSQACSWIILWASGHGPLFWSGLLFEDGKYGCV